MLILYTYLVYFFRNLVVLKDEEKECLKTSATLR